MRGLAADDCGVSVAARVIGCRHLWGYLRACSVHRVRLALDMLIEELSASRPNSNLNTQLSPRFMSEHGNMYAATIRDGH